MNGDVRTSDCCWKKRRPISVSTINSFHVYQVMRHKIWWSTSGIWWMRLPLGYPSVSVGSDVAKAGQMVGNFTGAVLTARCMIVIVFFVVVYDNLRYASFVMTNFWKKLCHRLFGRKRGLQSARKWLARFAWKDLKGRSLKRKGAIGLECLAVFIATQLCNNISIIYRSVLNQYGATAMYLHVVVWLITSKV